MPRPRDARTGERATIGQRTMHYSPFLSDAPKSHVLVSDPWGDLDVSIQRQANSRQKPQGLCEDARWFVNLADEYYQAASASKSITRSLLYYYGWPIVQEAALIQALQEGWIAGAGLDVFDVEPLPPEHPLYGLPQVIITPQVSGITPQFFERIATIFTENIRRYVRNAPLANVIDVTRGY